ncbi:flagellar hook-associated protein 3 FlgL [Rhodoblastus acidophilus]|uniref:Flagellin n=1 Tax=Rhodoblastus acidophilus TaxID=1074 RepID=A0A212RQV5_RHOAC|nr:flagellar hook-associated family protein [Rhodoblastus acidophilus]PPQ38562.1 hypothetical protein CKO16_09730 [Rhodoblastus acidophilus]RAI21875.1 hypothetical protein CH337_06790 [Rhodoblastus acidophilus]SNB74944.1 flagellar hook-associated protein 3 FlgL [Rhodoblastus acidophilus]
MAVNSVSTSTLSNILQNTVSRLQSQMTSIETENATGLLADIGLTLGADSGRYISMHQQYAELNGLTASNVVVTTQLDTAYTAVTTMQKSAANVLKQVITGLSTTPSSTGSAAIQSVATGALSSFIAGANSEVAGVYVFGGINTATQPINAYSAPPATSAAQQAVQTVLTNYLGAHSLTSVSQMTGAQMQEFLTATPSSTPSLPANQSFASLFQSGAASATPPSLNWSDWSKASDTPLTNRISLKLTETTSVSANNQAFQSMAQGLTMLSEFANQNLTADAYTALMQTAQKTVNTASSQLTETAATIGTMQNSVNQSNSSIKLQQNVLNKQINAREAVDPYKVASDVTNLSTQLQVAYSLTSQIHKLSLVNFL